MIFANGINTNLREGTKFILFNKFWDSI